MCENCHTHPHHSVFDRHMRPRNKSAVQAELEDWEHAFGLLESIQLECPEVHTAEKALWDRGIYDPHKNFREKYKSLDTYPEKEGTQAHQHYSL